MTQKARIIIAIVAFILFGAGLLLLIQYGGDKTPASDSLGGTDGDASSTPTSDQSIDQDTVQLDTQLQGLDQDLHSDQ